MIAAGQDSQMLGAARDPKPRLYRRRTVCDRERVRVPCEGVLRTNRLADAVGADRPFIDAPREPVIDRPSRPKASRIEFYGRDPGQRPT
jgi:hypothetical protein